jgi:hypothetical protein
MHSFGKRLLENSSILEGLHRQIKKRILASQGFPAAHFSAWISRELN